MGAFASNSFSVLAFSAAAFAFDGGLPPAEYHAGGSWHEPARAEVVEFTDDEILTIVQAVCVSGLLES
jgi:hypothetical protein